MYPGNTDPNGRQERTATGARSRLPGRHNPRHRHGLSSGTEASPPSLHAFTRHTLRQEKNDENLIMIARITMEPHRPGSQAAQSYNANACRCDGAAAQGVAGSKAAAVSAHARSPILATECKRRPGGLWRTRPGKRHFGSLMDTAI